MAKEEGTLTQGRLRELLDYDPETGEFKWKTTRQRTKTGGRAGHLMSSGYLRVTIDGKRHMAHRLAWLYMTGAWPDAQIDHRDGSPSNNRFANLRAATRSQNAMNATLRADNRVGLKGVRYHAFVSQNGKPVRRKKPFAAVIKIGARQKTLGYFATAKEAHDAYCEAARRIFGDFARVG